MHVYLIISDFIHFRNIHWVSTIRQHCCRSWESSVNRTEKDSCPYEVDILAEETDNVQQTQYIGKLYMSNGDKCYGKKKGKCRLM